MIPRSGGRYNVPPGYLAHRWGVDAISVDRLEAAV